MKNFKRISGKNTDVLIIDRSGSKYISKCIPSKLSINIVDVRGVIPYIAKLSFFLSLIKRVFQFKLRYKSLIISIVDVINPKVIVSFVDTDIIMGQLDSIFPEKLVISVQNGARMHMGGFNNNNFLLPHYFAFGEYEKDLIEKLDIKYKTFHSIGSLKLGIFLNNVVKSDSANNSICFISDYENPLKDKFHIERIRRHKQVFSNLVTWNDVNCYNIKVALRVRANDVTSSNEVEFFNNVGDVELIERLDFSSYNTGHNSSIVISNISTIGYELFGAGKKVLFCGMTAANDIFLEEKGINYIMRKLPSIVLLSDLSQSEFNSKIRSLISMSNDEYLSLTKEAREYYMKCEKKYPHEAISEFIADFMQKEILTMGPNV